MAVLLFTAACISTPRGAERSSLVESIGLADGAYGVGVSIIAEQDTTRPGYALRQDSSRARARPMQIVMWYPASHARAVLKLRDYVEWSAGVLGPDSVTADRKRRMVTEFSARAVASGASQHTIESILASPTSAVLDAPRRPGRFPLVVFLHTSPWGASVMAEYLASHGFVVAAVESKGAREPSYRLTRENLAAMEADAAFTIARMRREPNVSSALGVIGMSNGAIAAVALQLGSVRPDAIVSLDGGIGENAGGVYLNERSNGNVSLFSVPLLHLYTADNPALELSHIRSYVGAPRMLVRVGRLRHGDFLTGAAVERVAPGWIGPAPADAATGFEFVCRYTYHFLRSQIAGDEASATFLRVAPESNGAPAGLLEIERIARG